MKKTILLLSVFTMSIASLQAQTLGDLLNDVFGGNSSNTNNSGNTNTNNSNTSTNNRNTNNNASVRSRNGVNQSPSSTTSSSSSSSGFSLNNLSNGEVVSGLRQALEIGAKNAGKQLSTTNGFFGNSLIKILLPPEVKQAESMMRQWGFGSLADKLILQMNRAAEDAATKAAPIFINAITSMSIQDGISILTGGQGAATNYLKQRTTAGLTNAFRPVIQNSLNKLNVASYWNQFFSAYNKLPITQRKINPNLTAYVTERALNGLFVTVAQEENKIRANPAARVTDLLQKVFGAK